jgi:hypothetical protein
MIRQHPPKSPTKLNSEKRNKLETTTNNVFRPSAASGTHFDNANVTQTTTRKKALQSKIEKTSKPKMLAQSEIDLTTPDPPTGVKKNSESN